MSILGARGRSSLRERMRGIREECSAPGAGDPAARARRPRGKAGPATPGEVSRWGLPGPVGTVSGIPWWGRSARRGACPEDLSRRGRRTPAPSRLPAGTKRCHARGRHPRAGRGDWVPGVIGALCIPPPGIISPAESGPGVQNQLRIPPPRPKIGPPQPQPTTCQCTPDSSLVMGTRDAGEPPLHTHTHTL